MTINTLVEDIYGLFGKEAIDLSSDLVQEFASNLSGLAQARLSATRREQSLRLSGIGKPARQQWMDLNSKGPKEEFRPDTLIKFMYGDVIEQLMLFLAQAAGHTVTHQQVEVEVEGVKGHPDAVIDGFVVDVKSASSFSFKKFEDGSLLEAGNDPFGYVAQLAGYVHALTPGRPGYFLAVDKTLGKICTLEVPSEVLLRYDVQERIRHMKEVVKQLEPPEKCYQPVPEGKSGNMKLAAGCSYCQHKQACWPEARTFLYGSGPVYLTTVLREPKVFEVNNNNG